jgi:hypothetical protein
MSTIAWCGAWLEVVTGPLSVAVIVPPVCNTPPRLEKICTRAPLPVLTEPPVTAMFCEMLMSWSALSPSCAAAAVPPLVTVIGDETVSAPPLAATETLT